LQLGQECYFCSLVIVIQGFRKLQAEFKMALIVKKSQLPDAGRGLFTTKAIAKGEKVIEYRGEIIEWKQYSERVKANKDGYLFFVSRKKCIDAWSTPQYKARYANDAAGFTRVKGLTNNCVYEVEDNRCYIVSIKPIKAGEEIFVSYTKEYWDVMRYNIRFNKEQEQKRIKKEKEKQKRLLKKEQRAKRLAKKKAAGRK
jgi:uncharacterized protein